MISKKSNTFTKRPATEKEIGAELKHHALVWDTVNLGLERSDEYWQEKQKEAMGEGYKNEVCSCGATFLAFHHMTNCQEKECPFSTGKTFFDMWEEHDKRTSTGELQ